MKGATLGAIARAGRGIARLSSREGAEQALSTLIHLAGYHYTVEQLKSVFGRRKMIQSSVWQAALAEGQAEGKAEGKAEGLVEGLRMACRGQIRRHHPNLLARAEPLIEACSDRERLQAWVVEASELDHDAFARLIGLG
jgi:predicted transposase YdaD